MIDLRSERERRGLSLDDVADRARIPRRYLAALEDGDHGVLPPGPFYRGYRRQYLDFLGLGELDAEYTEESTEWADTTAIKTAVAPEPTEITEPTLTPAPGLPGRVPVGRLVLAGFLVTLTVVLGARLVTQLLARQADAAMEAVAEARAPMASQTVRLRSVEPVRVTVLADGQAVHSGELAPGRTVEFSADQRLVVDAADLTNLAVWIDGERIEPLGNLSQRRRLVFVRDDGP